jgi:hypothetical protein
MIHYNKNYNFLHEDLDYSQMYKKQFNHDDKFLTFLTLKDVHNQNQHPLKSFNTFAFIYKPKFQWP